MDFPILQANPTKLVSARAGHVVASPILLDYCFALRAKFIIFFLDPNIFTELLIYFLIKLHPSFFFSTLNWIMIFFATVCAYIQTTFANNRKKSKIIYEEFIFTFVIRTNFYRVIILGI